MKRQSCLLLLFVVLCLGCAVAYSISANAQTGDVPFESPLPPPEETPAPLSPEAEVAL